ncbi:MAG: YfiR family protein [Salinivirgaceae bacterium]|nr:YfiR family protein [Salinivirgaceae bacterium]MDD4746540.1 YfiR family protein [Salinivirgaceae bacterium]MDY0280008.1 YfiR family protein [Salinivirgaceae bacterium]
MKRFLSLSIALFFAIAVYGQAEKVQAMFVYNFTKYVEWPVSTRSGNFVIAVYGNSPIYEELIKVAGTKSAGNQSIEVQKVKSVGDITTQHMIFISQDKSVDLGAIIGKIGSAPSLIITEADGLISKGSAINFVIIENRQRFELKKDNVINKGLKVSSELEKFAILK